MGLLDSLLGSVLGGGGAQSSGQAALVNAVVQMVLHKGGSAGAASAGGGMGGLGGLIGALTQGGLGQAASSWVGTGQNQPVSADQITQALGSGSSSSGGVGSILAQLAQQAGMSHGDAASSLSQILPGLVDKLTPNGQVPQQSSLEEMLGSMNLGK